MTIVVIFVFRVKRVVVEKPISNFTFLRQVSSTQILADLNLLVFFQLLVVNLPILPDFIVDESVFNVSAKIKVELSKSVVIGNYS